MLKKFPVAGAWGRWPYHAQILKKIGFSSLSCFIQFRIPCPGNDATHRGQNLPPKFFFFFQFHTENPSIILAYGQHFGAISWLMINVRGVITLWIMTHLDRWSLGAWKSKINYPWNTNQNSTNSTFLHGFIFISCLKVLAFCSCHDFSSWW